MAKQVIDVGTSASDGTGDPLREAFTKINENFTELYSTVENEGLTYGNISSNVAGVTFNVTRYTESYAAIPVLEGIGQVIGNVYLIRGNVLGGTTPLNDVLLTVTSLANVTVGNIATVSAVGVPVAPVLRVNGLTGNVDLTVNNIPGAASKAYVNAAIAANIANVTGTVTDSLTANITAANAVISNHSARIVTLESNSAAQALQINNLVSVKANVSYVDTSIDLALSSNAILANVAAVNANVVAANAEIATKASLNGADFSGNVIADFLKSRDSIRAQTYFVGGSETDQGLGQTWANPAALFFGNTNGVSLENKYYQINLQNLDSAGSGDVVITADDGNDGSNYLAVGVAGSACFNPAFPATLAHEGYVYVTGGNLDLQSDIGNVELIAGNLVTGQVIVTQSNIVKLGTSVKIQFPDGTLQSTAFGGNINVNSINANITAANAAISVLQSNASSQALELNNLVANAAAQASTINVLLANATSQATSIDLLNANVGSYQAFANSNAATQSTSISLINANIIAANLNISSLTANATAQALELDNLQANAQAQQGNIISLQSNASTQALSIDLINANLIAANNNITSLSTNAAVQGTQINLINANLVAANINIATLTSNASTQQLELNNLQSNVNFYLANVAYTDANIAAANIKINSIDANLGSTSTNVSILQGNIITLTATKANLISGNIQADYLIANANVKVAGIIEVGNASPVVYPGLAGVFVGNVNNYLQVAIQNLNNGSSASGDFVITADDGTDEDKYINIGINNSGFVGNFTVPAGDTGLPESPYDGYVTTIGGNLALRTDHDVFIVANTAAISLNKDGDFFLYNSNIKFRDGSIQQQAITDVPGLYANIGTIVTNLDTLDANIGTIVTNLDTLDANVGTIVSTTIPTLDANVGTLSLFQSNIVGNATYTPNNAANYNGTITNIQQALDELAARLRALGG